MAAQQPWPLARAVAVALALATVLAATGPPPYSAERRIPVWPWRRLPTPASPRCTKHSHARAARATALATTVFYRTAYSGGWPVQQPWPWHALWPPSWPPPYSTERRIPAARARGGGGGGADGGGGRGGGGGVSGAGCGGGGVAAVMVHGVHDDGCGCGSNCRAHGGLEEEQIRRLQAAGTRTPPSGFKIVLYLRWWW